jgi:hypothetical protein
MEDPKAVIAAGFEMLAPGGVMIVETPNLAAWDPRLFRKRYWGGWHCPRHWILYDDTTLRRAFEEAGFSIAATEYIFNPYCWLHSFQYGIRERWKMPRLARLFDVDILPSLVFAAGLDIVQKLLTRRTSNMRMIARKPA